MTNFEDVLEGLQLIEQADEKTCRGTWSVFRTLTHCAQSIEFSLDGYPKMKPAFVRATIGKVVLGRMWRRGALHHGLDKPIPGAPELPEDGDETEAIARVRTAIESFRAAGSTKPHFVFGELTKDEYERLHAYHFADHMRLIDLD